MTNQEILYRCIQSAKDNDSARPFGKLVVDAYRGGLLEDNVEECLYVIAELLNFTEDNGATVGELKDKIHRRNMQIEDLKKQIEYAEKYLLNHSIKGIMDSWNGKPPKR